MRPSLSDSHSSRASGHLPKLLPKIALRHGEAVWVLSRLGFQGAASKSTFYEYIKSLRKLGTPFERGQLGYSRRGLPNYSYCHLMELALILTLRVYQVVPDSILIQVARYRRSLNRIYCRAYAERRAGIGRGVTLKLSGLKRVRARGAYLDLQINFSGGRLTNFGPPRLLSPSEAMSMFAEHDVAARALLPINLSQLAERLVSTALARPTNRASPPVDQKIYKRELNND